MAVVGTLSVELTARAQKFTAAMKASQASAQQTSEALKSVSASAAKVGLAFGAIGGVVAKMTADFEKSMTRAAAIAGKTASGFEKSFSSMSAAAVQLSTTTEFTAKEVSEGMTFMAMAGNDAAKSIQAMPSVLQLASAASIDLGQSADIVTNIMAGFGQEGSELAKTNNTLIGTFTNANVSLTQLGASFRKVGPVASSLNVGIEDVSAVLGVLGNAGLQAEEAGTGLRTSLVKLVSATPKAEKAMAALGISTKTLSEEGLIGTIDRLEAAKDVFENTGRSAEFTSNIMEIFGLRAGPIMQAAVGQGADAIRDLRKAIDQANEGEGIAAFLERKQLETLTGQFNILRSNVEATALVFGKDLAQALRPVITVLQEVFMLIGKSPPLLRQLTVGVGLAVTALAGMVAVGASLLAILPSMIAGFGALSAGLAGMGLTISGVLVPVLGVLAAGLGGFFITLELIEEVLGTDINLLNIFTDALKTMNERADGVKIVLINAAAAILQVFVSIGEGIVTAFKHVANFVTDVFKALAQTVVDIGVFVGTNFAKAIIGAVRLPLEGLSSVLESAGLSGFGSAIESLERAGDGVTSAGERFAEASRTALDSLTPFQDTTTNAATKALRDAVARISDSGLSEEYAATAAAAKEAAGAADAEAKSKAEALAKQEKAAEEARKEAAEAMKTAQANEEAAKAAERRAKAIMSARESLEREVALFDTSQQQAELFDLGALKREFPELGELIGERARQVISTASIDDLPGVLEEAFGQGVISADEAQRIADNFISAANNAERIEKALTPPRDLFKDLLTDAFKGILAKLGVTEPSRGPLAGGATNIVSSIFGGNVPLQDMGKLIGDGIASSPKLRNSIGGALSDGFGPLFDSMSKLFSEGGALGKLLGGIGLGGAGKTIGTALGGIAGGTAAGTVIGSIAPGIGNVVGAALGAIVPKLLEQFGRAADAVRQAFVAVVGTIFNVVKSAGETVNDAITSVLGERTKVVFGGLFNPLVLAVGAVVVALAPVTAFIVTVLSPAIAGLSTMIVGAGVLFAFLAPSLIILGIGLTALVAVVGAVVGVLATLFAAFVSGVVAAFVLSAAILATAAAFSPIGLILVPLGVALVALMVAVTAVVGLFVALAAAQTGLLFAFAGLVRETESFGEFQQGFEAVIDRMVEAVEPFFQNLVPLIGLFDAFVDVLMPMISGMANIEGISRTIFEVFKALAIAVASLFIALGFVQTGLLSIVGSFAIIIAQLSEGVTRFVDWFGTLPLFFEGVILMIRSGIAAAFMDMAGSDALAAQAAEAFANAEAGITDGANPVGDTLRALADQAGMLVPDLAGMQDALGLLMGLTFEEAQLRGADLIQRKKDAEELNETMTNVPEGFKVSLERFRAIIPGVGEPAPGDVQATGGIDIDTVIVQGVSDLRSLVDEIETVSRERMLEQTGGLQGRQFQGGTDF